MIEANLGMGVVLAPLSLVPVPLNMNANKMLRKLKRETVGVRADAVSVFLSCASL